MEEPRQPRGEPREPREEPRQPREEPWEEPSKPRREPREEPREEPSKTRREPREPGAQAWLVWKILDFLYFFEILDVFKGLLPGPRTF